jgi:hypothetical protein
MHGSMRDRLEDLLGAEQTTGHSVGSDHLASCLQCSTELEKMKAQSEMLRLLRSSEDVEPAGGFYARVLQRIEEKAKDSIWSAFIYSRFANRLVYASLTIALAVGSYVIVQESRDGHLGKHSMVADNVHTGAPVFGDQDQQRNAVLENFAAY